MGFNESAKTAYEMSPTQNPFSVVLGRVNDTINRKKAEKETEEKELRELQNLFVELGKKYEYETEINKQKASIDLGLEQEKGRQNRLTEMSKGYIRDSSDNQSSGDSERRNAGTQIPLANKASMSSVGEDNDQMAQMFGVSKGIKKRETPVVLVDRTTGTLTTKDPTTNEMIEITEVPKGAKVLIKTPSLQEQATLAEVKSIAKVKPNLDRANDAIMELRGLFEKGDVSRNIKKGDIFGGLKERGRGVLEGITAKLGGNADLQQYLVLRKSFASLITKGGFLEAGVLTDDDISRALGALPNTGSTKEEIDSGWKSLNNIMTGAITRYNELIKVGGKEKQGKTVSSETKLSPEERSVLIQKIRAQNVNR